MKINKEEVLRYLGYKGQYLDEKIDKLIDQAINEINNAGRTKSTYRFFPLKMVSGRLLIKGTNIVLPGQDIKNHLKNTKDCIIMAATLGHEVDRLIRYYEKVSMTRALILDATASVAIEEAINKLNGDLEKEVFMDNKIFTSRYSPGYGDLPLSIQGGLLDILGAKKSIGLTANAHNILIPRKSITAILGIVAGSVVNNETSCEHCNMRNNCDFSKGGKGCGN